MSPAVGRATSKRLMPQQNPQRRSIRLAAEVNAEIGVICAIIKGTFWQTSVWDHFLRGDERLEQVVEYVLNNPVRSGLIERLCDYRVSGSSVFGLATPAGDKPPPYSENSVDAYARRRRGKG